MSVQLRHLQIEEGFNRLGEVVVPPNLIELVIETYAQVVRSSQSGLGDEGYEASDTWMVPGNEGGLFRMGPRPVPRCMAQERAFIKLRWRKMEHECRQARKDDPPDTDRYDHTSGILPPPVGSRG